MPYRVEPELGCWIWTGATDPNGVPIFKKGSRHTTARRYYFEREGREIPDGMVLAAICGRKNCVRPHHAEPMKRSDIPLPRKVTDHMLDQSERLQRQGISRTEVARRFGVDEGSLRYGEGKRRKRRISSAA